MKRTISNCTLVLVLAISSLPILGTAGELCQSSPTELCLYDTFRVRFKWKDFAGNAQSPAVVFSKPEFGAPEALFDNTTLYGTIPQAAPVPGLRHVSIGLLVALLMLCGVRAIRIAL